MNDRTPVHPPSERPRGASRPGFSPMFLRRVVPVVNGASEGPRGGKRWFRRTTAQRRLSLRSSACRTTTGSSSTEEQDVLVRQTANTGPEDRDDIEYANASVEHGWIDTSNLDEPFEVGDRLEFTVPPSARRSTSMISSSASETTRSKSYGRCRREGRSNSNEGIQSRRHRIVTAVRDDRTWSRGCGQRAPQSSRFLFSADSDR